MKRINRGNLECPMARSVNVIGEWGSLMILREAFGGVTRFDDFQKKLQMSRNLLTTRLKSLVTSGVMERRPIAADGKRSEYVLTPMGEDLVTTIVALRQWGDRWLFTPKPHPADMFDAVDGTKLQELVVRSAKGRRIKRTDIRLKRTTPRR